MSEIKYEIIEHFAVLSTSSRGWTKELNLVSWYGREPVYDLREWDANHFQMSRGITLTKDELSILREKLQEVEL